MPNIVENRVRTIIAQILNVPPENVRPETTLMLGAIGHGRMREIAFRICRTFEIGFFAREVYEGWTTVGDAIDAVEKVLERGSTGPYYGLTDRGRRLAAALLTRPQPR
jgi:acyl carrier protein